MLIDYERVVLELKRHIANKPHHGQRELSTVIAALEVRYALEEGLPERTLRLYGLEFFEEAIRGQRPGSAGRSVASPEGHQVRALRGDCNPQSEEDTDGSSNRAESGRAGRAGASGSRARAALAAQSS